MNPFFVICEELYLTLLKSVPLLQLLYELLICWVFDTLQVLLSPGR